MIRLARETIHLSAKTAAIHVRAVHPRRDLGGSLLAAYPLTSAERVRLRPLLDGRVTVTLELRGGTTVSLGEAPGQDIAMVTARVVADVTRCMVEVSGPATAVRAHLYEPTGRLYWDEGTLPSLARADEDPDTDPPDGWRPPADPMPDPMPDPKPDPTLDPTLDPTPPPVIVRGEPDPVVSFPAARAEPPEPEAPVAPRIIRGQPEPQAPVFLDLLRESQMYEPVMPTPMEDPEKDRATQVGIGGWRGRSTTGTRLRAIYEMLRLTSERLPVATESLALL
ncbi:MAG: hypothetical protein RIT81_05660 [Deltaproteobacteria bacterium]